MDRSFHDHDRAWTERNRAGLFRNGNLLFWYENLYKLQFEGLGDLRTGKILEIGSGTSPLKIFHDQVLTSDILELDYLDYCFDCHKIHEFDELEDACLDVITLTNVLHHLEAPLVFLENAACKLKCGGKVIITEPFFSVVSSPIYRLLHHEPADFSIDEPVLPRAEGPLSSANMAIPHLVFFSDRNWDRRLKRLYSFSRDEADFYTCISYMATGGISRRIPIPRRLFSILFRLDFMLARKFPVVFSSFFVLKLTRV